MHHFYPPGLPPRFKKTSTCESTPGVQAPPTCMMVALRPACLISSASAWPFCRASSCRSLKKFLKGMVWTVSGVIFHSPGHHLKPTRDSRLKCCCCFFWGGRYSCNQTSMVRNISRNSEKLRHSNGKCLGSIRTKASIYYISLSPSLSSALNGCPYIHIYIYIIFQ